MENDLLSSLPTWGELVRMFPVSVWSVGLVAVGYMVGRNSQAPYIKTLTELLMRRGDPS